MSRIKSRLVFNLTVRQLICFGSAAAVGIPAYLFTRKTLGGEGAMLLMIGLMLPFFFVAMYERDGQPAEKVLRNYIRAKLWPRKRPYKTANFYEVIEREGKAFAKQNKTAVGARKTPASCAKSSKKR